ncbi:MAG: aspartyl protease family protein, partial [Phycisphaerales bacterium]|nr:aspartyl protease family protein [Phycisphaerales bacterium]
MLMLVASLAMSVLGEPELVAHVPLDTALGKPSIEVMINDRGPYRLLVDTGASPPLILNDDLVKELRLETREGPRIGDPSNPEAIPTRAFDVGTVRIGDVVVRDVPGLTWNRSALYTGDEAPRGVIGLPLFQGYLVTFDYGGKAFELHDGALPEANGHTVLTYRTELGGIPLVPLKLNDVVVEAH